MKNLNSLLSMGYFYATKAGQVLTLDQVIEEKWNQWVDVGFSCPNAQFSQCTFFSPSQTEQYFATPLADAQNAVIINNPQLLGFLINNSMFESIKQPSDFDQFATAWNQTASPFFSQTDDEHYILLRMDDMRRGIIMVKQFVNKGDESYILTDIKMEKRTNE